MTGTMYLFQVKNDADRVLYSYLNHKPKVKIARRDMYGRWYLLMEDGHWWEAEHGPEKDGIFWYYATAYYPL